MPRTCRSPCGRFAREIPARVTGTATLTDLTASDAIAVLPAGWSHSDGITQVPIADNLHLPLIMLWASGTHPPAVERLQDAMTTPSSN